MAEFTEDVTLEYIHSIIKKRSPFIHKGDCGRVLIVAGGAGMTGAAVLSARAALRSGSGLVYVCTPKQNYPVVQTLAPEAICVDWNQVAGTFGSKSAGNWNYDAVAFGPGMGVTPASRRMLKAVLLSYTGPLVLDADGLNCLSADAELAGFARNYSGELVVTPHIGEAKRLLAGRKEAAGSREDMVRSLVLAYRCIAVLKGAGTLTARLEGSGTESGIRIFRNTTGNPGMATAGAGDVLTGVITSLAGQGIPLWDAARSGVWLHGRAGDIACRYKGEYGLIASDIVDALPAAFMGAAQEQQ